MSWQAYDIGPIDWRWEHLKTFKQTLIELVQADDALGGYSDNGNVEVHSVKLFIDDWELAKALASEKGWEGDFLVGPYVFWLPSEEANSFVYGFIFKQYNNGTTFVISPEPLPWLKSSSY